MRITGVMVQYYVACKRELWFYLNQINMNYEDDNILIGRQIHSETYKRDKKNILIDGVISVDFIRNENGITIYEIKKSSKKIKKLNFRARYALVI